MGIEMDVLYRAKKKSDGEWIEGYYAKLIDYLDGPIHVIFPLNAELYLRREISDFEEIIPETLGRLLGEPCYSNHTGQRYFQGDIIELTDFRGKLCKPYFGIVVDEYCFTDMFALCYLPQDTRKARVVGNVHDNPELVGPIHLESYMNKYGYKG